MNALAQFNHLRFKTLRIVRIHRRPLYPKGVRISTG
jgi:hypothetical protein